ncbi:MAG: hypothetical protein OCD00_19320 [Colwellia sp.]
MLKDKKLIKDLKLILWTNDENNKFQLAILFAFTSIAAACSGTQTELEQAHSVKAQQERVEWENPEIFAQNKLPALTTFYAYEFADLAKKQQREESAYFLSLNGDWHFNSVKKLTDRPKNFWQAGFEHSTWDIIQVPSNWKLQGMVFRIMSISIMYFRLTNFLFPTNIIR